MVASGRRAERRQMVKTQLIDRGITDQAVLRAMAEVPRHYFVPDRFLGLAYEDSPLPIRSGQTISQPYIVARMVELLELRPGDRVLDIGTGSGYVATILSRITCFVAKAC